MDHFFLDDKGLRHLLERIENYYASQSSLAEETGQRTEEDLRLSNLLTALQSALETNVSLLQGDIQSEETARTLADSNLSDLIKSIYDKDDDTEIESGVLFEKISDVLSSLESEEQSRVSEDRSLSNLIKAIYEKDSDTLVERGILVDKINETNASIGSLDSSLSSVAKSGDYTDLTNKPNLATVATSGDYTDLTNKPNLATVATSGSYNDLTDKPTIPGIPTNVSDFTNDAGYITQSDIPTDVSDFNNDAGYITADEVPAQVNSDWNSDSGASQILNKPALATVATSGSYNDLSDKPSLPDSPVQSDWNENDSSSLAYIQNKPTIPVVPTNVSSFTNDAGYITLNEVTGQRQSDWSQSDSTAMDFIKNKPTIPAAQVNSDWNSDSGVSQILNKPSLSSVATSGSYDDLSDKPTIPTVNNPTITFTQGGTTKGTITLNQSENSTIALDAGSDDITEIANRMDTVENTVSGFQDIIDNYELNHPVTRSEVTGAVNAAEGRMDAKLEAHKSNTGNPHEVTYNQVGLEVIEDIDDEPEEPENPDPSEEPEYKYIASIDYVKQYVSDKGIGLETLSDLEGTGREGVLYIYNETLYIWEEGEEEGEGEFVAVSTASSGVSHEIEEKVNTSYSHTFDTITNPHNITKGTLGLGNVDNTSDINKPLSNAAITELARKVNVAEIVDNLTTQSSVAPLSANMGYELSNQIAALELEVNSIGSALRFKGTVPSRSDLSNVQNPEPGDCYQVVSVDGQDPDEGHMFSYTSSNTWVEISGSFGIDFVAATMNEVQSIIDSYQRPNSNQNENNQTGEGGETGDGEDNGQTGEGGEGENNGQESEPVVDPNAEPSGN